MIGPVPWKTFRLPEGTDVAILASRIATPGVHQVDVIEDRAPRNLYVSPSATPYWYFADAV